MSVVLDERLGIDKERIAAKERFKLALHRRALNGGQTARTLKGCIEEGRVNIRFENLGVITRKWLAAEQRVCDIGEEVYPSLHSAILVLFLDLETFTSGDQNFVNDRAGRALEAFSDKMRDYARDSIELTYFSKAPVDRIAKAKGFR